MADTASSGSRTRLDALLVQRGLFQTRSRARDAILRGTVTADGAVVTRPGQQIAQGTDIRIDDPARQWVSRAALKLAAGLDAFGFDPAGCTCLDIGASTGGFTQVLLARGASRVYAIDVGHGQMDAAIAADPRVVNLEGINARDLVAGDIGDAAPDFLVSDVSFISLKLALPPALGMAAPGARGIFLVKPQFEAGREAIGIDRSADYVNLTYERVKALRAGELELRQSGKEVRRPLAGEKVSKVPEEWSEAAE